jgi:hypothetical protein
MRMEIQVEAESGWVVVEYMTVGMAYRPLTYVLLHSDYSYYLPCCHGVHAEALGNLI